MLVWTAAVALAAALAAVRLLCASIRPEPALRSAYRWFAISAGCWGVGGIGQQVFGGLIGGAAPLRAADLASLAALPALLIGLATLTGGVAGRDPDGVFGTLADSGLLVAALFVIGWVTLFGRAYSGAVVGPRAFAVDLIRPMADLVAAGVLLPFAVRNLRRTLVPTLALAAMTVGDALAVGPRIADSPAGPLSQLAWTAGLCLLAAAPSARPAAAEVPADDQARPASAATLIAVGAASAAAIVVAGFALGGGPVASPVLAVSGAAVVLLLVIRLAGLARQASAVSATAQDSDRLFRALAGTTSDAVVVCDLAGAIEYVSPAVGDYGYRAEQLIGTQLADLVHPQDRLTAIRAAVSVMRAAGTPGQGDGQASDDPAAWTAAFAGRARAADGSWRHVECALSRYLQAGPPFRLLVTARDVSDRVALRQQLTHLTFHDGLTGLPNRAFAEDRVKELLSQAEPPGVAGAILIDLDGYTAVNDLVGQGGGDLVLAQVGRRLRAMAPPEAMVARWGGDEFAILVAGADSAAEILELAEQLASRIAAEPFSAAGKDIPLTASTGVALTPVSSAEQLLNNADVAMSRAKDTGAGRVEVFAAAMHAEMLHRLELAAGLQQAISDRQLEIEYQPVVDLTDARVSTVEALVRWPQGGRTIPPREIFEVAEDSGLIVPLGDWVLREACRQVAAWHAGGLDVGLSVNVSFRQVSAPGFAASVLAALDEADLAPQALTLEVTERVLIDGAGPMVTELASLRGKGIRLAIDDFGTGYASLSYLPQLAVDIIKIDPSFIAGAGTDPTLTLLTKTIVQVGHELGIEVVAEGIERPEQLEQLRAMGCHLGQGFAVGRPMKPHDVAELLTRSAGSGRPAGEQAGAAACSPAG